MIKSLDELREEIEILSHNGIDTDELVRIADAIEREVESNYIELPQDANGIPVHVNDEMESVYSPDMVFVVKRLKYSEKHGWMIGGAIRDDLSEYHLYDCRNCHHYHAPTVEDVLREFAKSIADVLGGDEFLLRDDDEMYAEFAERLQVREAE